MPGAPRDSRKDAEAAGTGAKGTTTGAAAAGVEADSTADAAEVQNRTILPEDACCVVLVLGIF